MKIADLFPHLVHNWKLQRSINPCIHADSLRHPTISTGIAHAASTSRLDTATHWLQQTELHLLHIVDRCIRQLHWDDERISWQAIFPLGTSRHCERTDRGKGHLAEDEQVIKGLTRGLQTRWIGCGRVRRGFQLSILLVVLKGMPLNALLPRVCDSSSFNLAT
jgi:hypothetical protein